jgi:sugar lactone lactonase YvrE
MLHPLSTRLLLGSIAALLCACGTPGPQGPQGPQGTQGPAGTNGTNGTNGTDGTNGTNGTNGKDALPGYNAPLELPGTAFYPESINAASDGTLYIGSLTTGEIVKYSPGSATPNAAVQLRAAGADGVKGVTGILIDDATASLWFCAVDLSFMSPSQLKHASLSTGAIIASYDFPAAPAFCNDMVFDAQGNLYVTDSLGGTIAVLKKNGTALETWAQDAAFKPAMGAFGPDGIAFDGTSTLYMAMFNAGSLFRIPIQADGHEGTAQLINVTPALAGPDGLRLINANTLVLVEGIGNRVTRVDLTAGSTDATATPLDSRVDQPSAVVKSGDALWVTEGQIEGLLLSSPSKTPLLPFLITRVEWAP